MVDGEKFGENLRGGVHKGRKLLLRGPKKESRIEKKTPVRLAAKAPLKKAKEIARLCTLTYDKVILYPWDRETGKKVTDGGGKN